MGKRRLLWCPRQAGLSNRAHKTKAHTLGPFNRKAQSERGTGGEWRPRSRRFARAVTVVAAHRRDGVWAWGRTRREAVQGRRAVRRRSTTSVSIRGSRRATRRGHGEASARRLRPRRSCAHHQASSSRWAALSSRQQCTSSTRRREAPSR